MGSRGFRGEGLGVRGGHKGEVMYHKWDSDGSGFLKTNYN